MENISFEDFKKIELKVAEIIEAKEHPNADKLLVLKVQVGQDLKQIVAGIKNHYDIEDLKGKKIVIVNNLDPVTLRGEESQGMLLAASTDTQLTLVTPGRDFPSGANVR